VKIIVPDTGKGIQEDDLPHIFEKFYRSDKSRATPGNGLGLSLVQSFVKAHNGEISVKSRPGEGTTFTVILPRSSCSHLFL
jgi:signal transduction histidine kinase